MKFTLSWLLTASVLMGLVHASSEQSPNYDLLRRLVHDRSLEGQDSTLAMRLIDLIEAREAAAQAPFEVKMRDDSQDPTPSKNTPEDNPPSSTPPTTTSAAPMTVLTPTGSVVVIASQGTTHTYSLNATGSATATSTVVLVVTNSPKPKNAASSSHASVAFTGFAFVGALVATVLL